MIACHRTRNQRPCERNATASRSATAQRVLVRNLRESSLATRGPRTDHPRAAIRTTPRGGFFDNNGKIPW